jgi:hypothetical protein
VFVQVRLHVSADAAKVAQFQPMQTRGQIPCLITTSPSGFCMSEAVFARNGFGAMPMEQRKNSPTLAAMVRLIFRANSIAFSRSHNRPVNSQTISSIDQTSST